MSLSSRSCFFRWCTGELGVLLLIWVSFTVSSVPGCSLLSLSVAPLYKLESLWWREVLLGQDSSEASVSDSLPLFATGVSTTISDFIPKTHTASSPKMSGKWSMMNSTNCGAVLFACSAVSALTDDGGQSMLGDTHTPKLNDVILLWSEFWEMW